MVSSWCLFVLPIRSPPPLCTSSAFFCFLSSSARWWWMEEEEEEEEDVWEEEEWISRNPHREGFCPSTLSTTNRSITPATQTTGTGILYGFNFIHLIGSYTGFKVKPLRNSQPWSRGWVPSGGGMLMMKLLLLLLLSPPYERDSVLVRGRHTAAVCSQCTGGVI